MIKQTDIPNNTTNTRTKNCHISSPKPWSLLEKMVKNCIIWKKTASVKIPTFRRAESTFTILDIHL